MRIVIIGLLILSGTAASAQTCPTSIPPDATTAVSFGERASSRFCGNARKYHNNGTPEIAPPDGRCLNNPNAQLTDQYAVESAEIRGWIVGLAGSNNGEDEYTMDVVLDVGWLAIATSVVPINTVQAVAQALTPQNIIAFGQTPPYPGPPVPNHPAPQYPGASAQFYSTGSAVFGSTSAAVVHVEIDGWGPWRTCGYDLPGNVRTAPPTTGAGPPDWCPPGGSYDYLAHAPSGWVINHSTMNNPNVTGFLNGTFWPGVFKDSAGNLCFQVGDYVRIVGTLWHDGLHVGGGAQGQAELCWQQESTPNIGWTEMHPVDYITKLPPPTARLGNASMDYGIHTLGAYAICSTDFGSYQGISFTKIPAYPPVPFSGAGYENNVAHVTEVVHDPYVNWLSLVPPYNSASQSTRTGVSTDGKSVSLQVIVQATQDHRGLFSGFYDIYWTCTPSCSPNRCLSDGCGGLSCPNTCTGNFVCAAGTDSYSCQCPPPNAVCASTGACIPPADCPVCPVSVSTNQPTGMLIYKGTSATASVTATAGGGSQGVSFSAPNVPSGLNVTFNPASTTVGTASTMTVTASSLAPGGTDAVGIVATPSVCPQASTNLSVTVACPPGYQDCGPVCRSAKIECP